MKEKIIYALGFFDGVHLGHQALLAACRRLADSAGANTGVVTFSSHPDALVLGQSPKLINTSQDRNKMLHDAGMDTVIALPFDRALMTMPWQDFIHMLRSEYHAAGFVCGSDFRFGHKGEGTAAILQEYCKAAGLPCSVVPEQTVDGVTVSSTHIRKLLEAGDMKTAVKFLGHPHILTGTVISGRHIGRTLGIPTANLALPEDLVQPRLGVYACKATVEGSTWLAVTNVGSRPTVGGHHVTVEPWLLDFEGDLYGKELTLAFCEFLRPEQKFDSLEELKIQIHHDAAETFKLLR